MTGASAIPFAPGGAARRTVAIDGRPPPDGDSAPTARVVAIANDYFEALGLGLQRGRSFTDRDGTAGNDNVIVNRRFADLLLTDGAPPVRQPSPDGSARRPTDPAGVRAVPPRGIIGRRIRLTPDGEAGEPGPWLTIVGISPTVRQSMAEAPGPVAYLPYRAEPLPFLEIVEQVCSSVVILREGRVAASDRIERLEALMNQSSLEHVFTQLAVQDDAGEVAGELMEAMKL